MSVNYSPLDISRLWALVRFPKFGVHLRHEKLDAILRGDESGTVVNRAFVCGPQSVGMLSLMSMDDRPAVVRFLARRAQTAWESIAELFKNSDYRTCLQTAILVASSKVHLRLPQLALLYIQKCCDLIKAGNMRFIPICGRPPEFSEDLHETLAILSQTIYWVNFLFLMRGDPEPHATADLEREFRRELPVGGITSFILHTELILYCSELIRFCSGSAL